MKRLFWTGIVCATVALAAVPVYGQVGLAEEAELLEEVERLVEEFERQTKAYRSEVHGLVERQYQERRDMLQQNYERAIRDLETTERARRENAIARFEAFLRSYPNDPVYSPDAMFRLAELYFERSNDNYLTAMRQFDEDIDKFDNDEMEEEPVQPSPHYEPSIALYQQMITDFPKYRLIDGAYYLLGYCLGEQGEEDAALQTFLKLATGFPKSRFYAESWMRIGEFYFDADRLEEAVDAYTKVVTFGPTTKFYDKGLYKLAWTHYRLDMFDDAISEFLTLVDFADAEKERGNTEAQSLRPESIQYVAISFADERWDRGIGYDFEADETGEQMVDFSIQYFNKVGHRPYEKEIVFRLGNILFDSAKYPGSVKALKYALQLDPLAPNAPDLQQKVVEAWERGRQFDLAAKERDELFARFVEGSDWFEANRDDSDAMRKAAELTKNSLYTSAIFHHQQAQKYWADKRLDVAKVEYEQAAKGYQRYLDRFPHDKDAYELQYYLADCYFYSLDFVNAAEAFTVVRDSSAGKKYKIDAALNVIFSLEEEIKRLEKAGKMESRKVLDGSKTAEALPEAEQIPKLRKDLTDACDAFVGAAPGHERVAAVMYKAAEIYYVYNHYDEANKRFQEILDKFPGDQVAEYAANLMIEQLIAQKDWEKVKELTDIVIKRGVGDSGKYVTIGLGAIFNNAKRFVEEGEKLLEQGKVKQGNAKLEAGAKEYVRLVTENKDHEFADKALFNAAVAYERVRRFGAAAQLYERVFNEYPKSDLADKALFLIALKSEQSFDFDKAISKYLKLVREYPKSQDRANALFNAALALENTQEYERAAKEYERYASMFSKREDAPETFFRAGIVHEKRGDDAAMVRTFARFVQKYKRDPRQGNRIVEAMVKIGDHYRLAKKTGDSRKQYAAAVREFKARGLSNNSVAGYQAAKARFYLVEIEFRKYEAMAITGKSKKQQKGLEKKATQLKEMETLYREVLEYKQIEWSLAALYRLGYLYENLADTILKAECPKDISRMGQDYCDEYIILLEDQAAKLEEKIVPAYELAYKEARKAKVVNEWTKLTLEGLNRFRKKEYPIDKEPKSMLVGNQASGAGLVVPDELKAKMGGNRRMEGK